MNNCQVIPVYIKPKLIPFLCKNFDGIEANYLNHKVKSIDIKLETPLGSFIRLQMEKLEYPVKDISGYNMFLNIRGMHRQNFGKLYKYTKGDNSFLHLPKNAVDKINEYLYCIFQTALFNFLNAWSYSDHSLSEGILEFMDQNDLLKEDFNTESIRRSFYRWKKKQDRLNFFTKSNVHRVTA